MLIFSKVVAASAKYTTCEYKNTIISKLEASRLHLPIMILKEHLRQSHKKTQQ